MRRVNVALAPRRLKSKLDRTPCSMPALIVASVSVPKMRRSPIGQPGEIFVESISARLADRQTGIGVVGVSLTPFGRKLTRVKRSIDRSLPNRLRRLTWKNPRGAT